MRKPHTINPLTVPIKVNTTQQELEIIAMITKRKKLDFITQLSDAVMFGKFTDKNGDLQDLQQLFAERKEE